jgi:hypothetical protein
VGKRVAAYGRVFDGLSAARVVARWAGGSHELTLDGRYFVGGTPAMYGHRVTVVVYDSSGREIARVPNP